MDECSQIIHLTPRRLHRPLCITIYEYSSLTGRLMLYVGHPIIIGVIFRCETRLKQPGVLEGHPHTASRNLVYFLP